MSENPFFDLPDFEAIQTEKNSATTELEQRTFEWHLKRMFLFTGSRIPALMKQGRGKGELWGATALGVINEMYTLRCMTDEGRAMYIAEQMRKDFVQTRWGNENEAIARQLYEEKTGYKVVVTGFTVNPTCEFHGGSFDGEVQNAKPMAVDKGKTYGGVKTLEITNGTGIIEIKCPFDPMKHMDNYDLALNGLTPDHDYYPQIQSNIETAKADWCDFISFDPRQGEEHRLVIIRVLRDEFFIEGMMNRIRDAKKIFDLRMAGVSVKDAVKEVVE